MLKILKDKAIILFLIVFTGSCSQQEKPSETGKSRQITDMHTSRISSDWQGEYHGVLPCADCEGIETEITLNEDLTYKIRSRYLGESDSIYSREGEFSWGETGSKITLKDIDNTVETNSYLVGENKLIKLDMSGNRIKGVLESKYVLQKETVRNPENF